MVCVHGTPDVPTCATGLLAAGDGQRRLRGLAACRIQRLARRYIWTATKNRREAAARAEREAQLVAQMEELRVKLQGEINELRVSVCCVPVCVCKKVRRGMERIFLRLT